MAWATITTSAASNSAANSGFVLRGGAILASVEFWADNNSQNPWRPEVIYWGSALDNARDTVRHAKKRHAKKHKDVEGAWRRDDCATHDTLKAIRKRHKLKMLARLARR